MPSHRRQETPVEFGIFIDGIAAGFLTGIGYKTGISPDESGLVLLVLKSLCDVTENVASGFDCWSFIFYLSLLFVAMSIVGLAVIINRVDEWKVGLVIFTVGFAIGLFVMFAA